MFVAWLFVIISSSKLGNITYVLSLSLQCCTCWVPRTTYIPVRTYTVKLWEVTVTVLTYCCIPDKCTMISYYAKCQQNTQNIHAFRNIHKSDKKQNYIHSRQTSLITSWNMYQLVDRYRNFKTYINFMQQWCQVIKTSWDRDGWTQSLNCR